MRSNVLDGIDSTLAGESILLVGQLSLELFENPEWRLAKIRYGQFLININLLCGGISFFDISVDEAGEIESSAIDLILRL